MMTRARLAAAAARQAARIRARLSVPPDASTCPFDAADALNVLVSLQRYPSLEGFYSPARRPTIVLSNQRRWGRIRHTCAHELGHHVFGHGDRIDQLRVDSPPPWSAAEFVADRFATALLMPKLAVSAAIWHRQWEPTELQPEQTYVLAQDFGVGYSSLISHLERTLKMIRPTTAEELRRSGKGRLRNIRAAIAGFEINNDVFVADYGWGGRPVDVEIGDVIVVPDDASFSGRCAEVTTDPVRHLLAVAAGEGKLELPKRNSPISVRVCRRDFVGLAKYRHLDEPTDV